MNPQSLQELPLRDIHLPEAVSWWPPAIGWWILPILIFLIIFLAYHLVKYKSRQQRFAYRKFALKELQNIKQQFADSDNDIQCIRAVSKLLRQVALSYLPREEVAGLTGNQWITQLNRLSGSCTALEAHRALITTATYKPQVDFDQRKLLKDCEQWIQSLPATPDKQIAAKHAANIKGNAA